MRALLVEDSRTCAAVAVAALRAAGYSVERLSSVRGARGAMQGPPYTIAILDAHVPEVDGGDASEPRGVELADEMRRRMPSCRVVIWTGVPSPELRGRAEQIGARLVVKDDLTALTRALVAE